MLQRVSPTRRFAPWLLLGLALLAGCAALTRLGWEQRYGGSPTPPSRVLALPAAQYPEPEYYRDIKPIFDRRCVACHGCYDAPCQLKLTSFSGVERGASERKVYDGTRLLAENLTRLFIDAQGADEWRRKDFYPVLNEYRQDTETNLAASSLYQMLELKRRHPLPEDGPLPDSFDFSLDRKQQCTRVESFDKFSRDFPQWGMPYGMPAIEESNYQTIKRWLETGAKVAAPPALSGGLPAAVLEWERFLNGDSLQQQLMSRYLYEHLYLGDLYFDGLDAGQFFKLVRSKTPSGQPIEPIPTRRPYDDPRVERVYYRLDPIYSTLLVKSHMPYALNAQRMAKWRDLFLRADYTVTALPSYEPAVASNPFKAFREMPVRSRYRFMLDEAQFTIMGFIKGPVCRGQVALNVINDQFWVAFINPDLPEVEKENELLSREMDDLRMPIEAESNAVPLNWFRYADAQKRYLAKKNRFLRDALANYHGTELQHLWSGDGDNQSAALTVFRHFDSATVVKGFVGDTPKTGWVVGYALLERIHYLLVAGYDVYGNVGHQLMTRMYMDFLRMEGEANFLTFLPLNDRQRERELWYRNVSDDVSQYVYSPRFSVEQETAIHYSTDHPVEEFFTLFGNYLGGALSTRWSMPAKSGLSPAADVSLRRLQHMQGRQLTLLPNVALLSVGSGDKQRVFTLVRNQGHANVSTLLFEEKQLLPDEDTLSVVPGILGAYPNMFFDVAEAQLPEFVAAVDALSVEADYRRLVDRFGVRRNSPRFWSQSDWLHVQLREQSPVEAGVLDYNRLENR